MIDAFKIGVHLGFSSNGLGLMGLLRGELGKLHGAAKKAEEGFSALKVAAIGATAIVGGAAGLKVLWHMVDAARELNHQLVKIKIGAALGDGETANVRTDAYQMTKEVPGVQVEDAVKVQRELFGTFGDMKDVHDTLKGVLQANVALSRYGDKDTDVAQVAIRALVMRGHVTKDGKVDPGEFNKELDSLTRSIIASEGMLKPNDYLQSIRQMGPAATAMDPNAFWGMMPAAMVAMGSAKAGTAMSSLFTQVIGHVLAGKRIAVAMQDAGMLKPGSWKVEKGGHVLMDKDAVVNQTQFAHDPFTYLHDMLERMKGQTDKSGKPVDMVGIIQQIFQLSSRVTSARLINDVSQNWPEFQNEQRRYGRSPDASSAAAEQNKGDLGANVANLDAAWKNFMTALGEPGIPLAIDILHKLTVAVTDMSLWASTHGDTVLVIEKVVGSLSALAIAAGGLAVGSAAVAFLALTGPAGWLVLIGAGAVAMAGGLELLHTKIQGLMPSWLSPGKDAATGKTPLEQLHDQGGTGIWNPLSMFHHESYVPPANANRNVPINNIIYMDGRKVAEGVTNHQVRAMGGASGSGTTGPDVRTSAWPSMAFNA